MSDTEVKWIRVYGVLNVVVVVLLVIIVGAYAIKLSEQQRQIDHICRILPQILVNSDPLLRDHHGFKSRSYRDLKLGEYSLYFANYRNEEALLFCYSEQQHLLVYNLPKGLLEGWDRYSNRKLPLE